MRAQQIQIIQQGGEQIQMPPGLGPRQQFKTGTARIRGRVLSSDTGGALRRAQVRIMGSETAPKTALTDADGNYELRDLPAGRFTLTATKTGYVSVQYGQTRPFESGKQIELADKQVLDKADIVMPRGSVISGRIVDEFGEPMPDVTVTALRQSWVGGRRRLAPVGGRLAQTNDLGQFRLYGLAPGDYYVSATFRSGPGDMVALDMLAGSGTIFGGQGGASNTSSSGYAPTYFPGTSNAADAQKIAVAPGQEAGSADFALLAVKLAKVSGVALSSEGKPLEGAMVSMMPVMRSEFALGMVGSSRTTKDGLFNISNVPPGEYTAQVRPIQVTTTSDGANTMMFRTTIGGAGADGGETGSTPVTVTGEDIANVVITTSKGATATGHVTFEGGRPPSPGTLRISATALDSDGPALPFGNAPVKEDGTFELKGLTGTRMIRVNSLPQGWMLKAVRLNGTDITDTGAEFKAGDAVSGLEVMVASPGTTVIGGVAGPDGSPLKDYTVVLFAENPELWRVPLSRWVTGTRPNQEGRFNVANLPAGSYYAAAVEYVPQGEWADPELLEKLKAKATRFDLGDGETRTLDLKILKEY